MIRASVVLSSMLAWLLAAPTLLPNEPVCDGNVQILQRSLVNPKLKVELCPLFEAHRRVGVRLAQETGKALPSNDAMRASGLPPEFALALTLVNPDTLGRRVVQTPKDLGGCVSIDSEQEALEYLRFFSASAFAAGYVFREHALNKVAL